MRDDTLRKHSAWINNSILNNKKRREAAKFYGTAFVSKYWGAVNILKKYDVTQFNHSNFKGVIKLINKKQINTDEINVFTVIYAIEKTIDKKYINCGTTLKEIIKKYPQLSWTVKCGIFGEYVRGLDKYFCSEFQADLDNIFIR